MIFILCKFIRTIDSNDILIEVSNHLRCDIIEDYIFCRRGTKHHPERFSLNIKICASVLRIWTIDK
jgi:hypothetical protein